jgi:hypothetical protein
MRLSQAIRLGAMLRPQGRAGLLVNGKTCALGAACEAVGITTGQVKYDSQAYKDLRAKWPFLDTEAYHESLPGGDTVLVAIWKLNDIMGHTREQIADWVETIEEGTDVATVLHATSESRA